MDCRIRNIALLFLVLVLAAGLASAQTGVKVSQVNSNGSVTQTTINADPGGPVAKAPTGGLNNTYKYWDGLASTDFTVKPPNVTQLPNPQVAVGPDDIFTVVNRTIARYPNPNAGLANIGVTNPYNNPALEQIWLDTWLGITNLATLCPNLASCVLDNASIRYDQMQGRFVVLFTLTDVLAHRSNFVLIVSRSAQFNRCGNTTPIPVGCVGAIDPAAPLFTTPVIAPIVGGTGTGGVNAANWFATFIPINVTYTTQPTALGNGVAGAVNNTGGANPVGGFVTTNFCGNAANPGGPTLPLIGGAGGTLRSCTNYYPTGARMGLDNDNIILTAPVLDQMFSNTENFLPVIAPGLFAGPYVGTRVVSVAKLLVYNAVAPSFVQPPTCTADTPIDCQAVNLSDNVRTGTLTEGGLNNAPCNVAPAPAVGICAPIAEVRNNPIRAIFWEPDNLRGRALASFDAQVAPVGATAGVITPIDYLVGTAIYFNDGTPGTLFQIVPTIFLQPIVYNCPGQAIYAGPSGVTFCGGTAAGQVADLPVLGALFSNVLGLASVANANPVGQGMSAQNQAANDGTSMLNKRLFVGDSRPSQVMFREGLLYVARTARIADNFNNNPLGTSTVLYDIVRTCSGAAPSPTCGIFSASGAGLGTPTIALETEWFNGQSVPDQAGNIPGFGFYTPMFESPADVTASGPTSPIALFPWLEKLFVGMTTGGTSNLAATFSKNFPSLWDFRPGDDAYDTVAPYIDPYTGFVRTTVPCASDLTAIVLLTNASKTFSIPDTTGLGVGMFVTVGTAGFTLGNGTTISAITPSSPGVNGTITLSNAPTVPGGNTCTNGINPGSGTGACTGLATLAFSRITGSTSTATVTAFLTTAPTKLTLNSTAGVSIGQSVAGGTTAKNVQFGAVANPSLQITGTTPNINNVGIGEVVTAGPAITALATTLNTSAVINVPFGTALAVGEAVSGTGIQATTTVVSFVRGAPDTTVWVVTLNLPVTASGTGVRLTFDPAACFTNVVVASVAVTGVVTTTGASACSTASADAVPVDNGIGVTFSAATLFPANLVVSNIGTGNVVTLNGNAAIPASITLANPSTYPVVFTASVGLANAPCPMIPWSNRGGASTDPNDGSLWLYGAFAKQRLGNLIGPGQWGTSIANYALDFPAVDPYNNDNTFFGDVPAGSQFFIWIQIAKNLGIAQPTSLSPCPTTPAGNPPILQPPAGGTGAKPGTPQLLCPFFSPLQNVTRAEMAYWVIRAQMDEQMVTNYLLATGGDPAAGITASSFSDVGAAGASITNPFLASSGVSQAMLMRYIEVMYRRGYTKGCQATDDPLRRFCPNDLLTRGQMSVFLIRAKMNNVFPTTLSGIPLSFPPYGDNFGLFTPPAPYFSDVTTAATDPYKDFYIYIQKMRELRITNGTTGSTFSPGANITRQEIATFIIRAFFL